MIQASWSGYLCSGRHPRDQEPDIAAPHQGLQGRKEQPLHTDGTAPLPKRPSDLPSASPLPKGQTLPGQASRAPPRVRLATALAHTTPGELRGAGIGDAPPRWLAQPRGLSETEGERGRNAGSMKKGASCERKQAWISSGKAGAKGGGAGGGRPVDTGVVPACHASPRSSCLTAQGSRAVTHSLSSSRASQPLGPQEGTISTRLPISVVDNKRVVTALPSIAATGGWRVCLHSHWVTDDWLLPAGVVQDWLAIMADRNSTVSFSSFSSVNSWFSEPGLVFL